MTLLTVFAVLFTVTSCSAANNSSEEQSVDVNIHNPEEFVSDSQMALQYLKDGNQRYLTNKPIERDSNAEDREALKDGQRPFAVIITCSDSRVSPEIYFDQKLGDIFVIRNAGNIADKITIGSIEYAVEHLGTPLVVVVGHSSCGAVTAAFDGGENPNDLQSIIDKISSNIEDCDDLEGGIRSNIVSTMETIKEDIVIKETNATVIGAHYDIESGKVSWIQ